MATREQMITEKERLLRRLRLVAANLAAISAAWDEQALATSDEIRAAVEDGLADARHANDQRRAWQAAPASDQPRPAATKTAARSDALDALLRAAARRAA